MKHPRLLVLVFLTSVTFSPRAATTTVPFELAGKLIIINGSVNGQPGNFILDTGVEHLVLNSRYFQGKNIPNKLLHSLTGEPVSMQQCISSLQIGELILPDIYSEIVPLQGLESVKELPIHGLIGTRVLLDFELLIDFSRQRLTFLDTDRQGNSGFLYLPAPLDTVTFSWKGFLPALSGRVGEEELLLALDTGAEISWLTPAYQERLASYLTQQRRATTIASFTTNTVRQPVNMLQKLHLDGWSCPPARFVFGHLDAHNTLPGPRLSGLIGYELLSTYQLAINFKKREIYVWLENLSPGSILVSRYQPAVHAEN